MKINILYVIPQLNPGGAEKQLLELVKYLSKDQFNIFVCSLDSRKQSLKDDFLEAGAKVYIIDKKSRYDTKFLIELVKIAKENKIDIIHTYLNNIWGILVGLICRVSLLYGYERSLGTGKKISQKIIEKLLSYFTKKTYVNSHQVLENLKGKYLPFLQRFEKYTVLENGIDINLYSTKRGSEKEEFLDKSNLPNDTIIIGIVASLRPVKNHIMFLESAKKIVEEGMKNVHFIIIGEGPLRKELNDLVNNLNLDSHVTFLGFQKEISQWFKIIDITVSSSLEEGFSNSIIESLSVGTPVIATKVGGSSSIIHEEYNGFLIEINNVNDLADKIRHIINHPDIFNTAIDLSKTIHRKYDKFIKFKELEVEYLNAYNRQGG